MLVSRETEGTKREVLDDDGHETFRSSVFLTTQEGPLLSASSMRSDRRQRHCAAPQLHPMRGRLSVDAVAKREQWPGGT